MEAPLLDTRSAADVVEQARLLAGTVYLPGQWQGVSDPGDPAFRLQELFGRLMEILIERLNQAPEKDFLAFLDTVGVEPSPGFPAAAPVTFLPSAKTPDGGQIPAGTQVATTQTDKADAQIFETRQAIFATPARLAAIMHLLPAADRWSELPPPALPPKPQDLAAAETTIFSEGAAGLQDIPHVLYLGGEALFGRKESLDVALLFTAQSGDASLLNGGTLAWMKFDKLLKQWAPTPAAYLPVGPGQVKVVLSRFGDNAKAVVGGQEDFWVAAHFIGLFPPGAVFPRFSAIQGNLAPADSALEAKAAPDLAFANLQPLDLSKPFRPFGAHPGYGDAVYISSAKAFAPDVETVILNFTLHGYSQAALQEIFQTSAPATLTTTVLWQYAAADGSWKQLTEFTHVLTFAAGSPPPVSDSVTRDGAVTTTEDGTFFGALGAGTCAFAFHPPADIATRKVNGQDGLWIRALLKSESPYGRDAFLVDGSPPKVVGPTLIPPMVEVVELAFTYKSQAQDVPRIVADNNFSRVDFRRPGAPPLNPVQPFVPPLEQSLAGGAAFAGGDALYLGFDRPFGDVFISLYFHMRENFPSVETPAEGGQPSLVWEYLAEGEVWKTLDVADDTTQLTGSGTVAFSGPSDPAVPALFASAVGAPSRLLYWMRARLAAGRYDYPPVFKGIYPNTVLCDNRVSFQAETILGSGSGEAHQALRLPKAPILAGGLWVREPEIPPQAEMEGLEAEFSQVTLAADPAAASATDPTADPAGEPLVDIRLPAAPGSEREVWVRWRRVPNFLGSGPRSRHYTLNPLSGDILLGDGERGLLAPLAKDNLVFRGLRSGGGEAAVRAGVPLAIKELKSSLPYVEKVFNVEAAVGGSDPWTLEQIQEFGPQFIKNKGRAVSAEDFEWLVLERFSQVARVKCLPTRAPGPAGLVFRPGAVTVVVVPKGAERFPRPTAALLRVVRDFLAGQALGAVAAEVFALGPGFTEVAVRAQVRALDPRGNSEVESRAVRALELFFHPILGGERGDGWAFGRDVQVSEIFAVLQRVEGVDFVAAVEFPDYPGVTALDIGENNLVGSGVHRIEMI